MNDNSKNPKSGAAAYAAQKVMYDSGNELAAYAAKQINYHVMGYYPITPSTQIAENLDVMGAEGLHDIRLIAAEGEHSAAGICYGASAGGGRVFNATSANGLLYALEQFPVQSGTRMPMVMNVACRTVSGRRGSPSFSRNNSILAAARSDSGQRYSRKRPCSSSIGEPSGSGRTERAGRILRRPFSYVR